MDDEAASQQLMSEARATHTTDYEGPAIPLQLTGASQDMIASTPKPSKKKAKRPMRKQLAASQTSFRDGFRGSPVPTLSLKEMQDFVGPSPSKSQTSPSTMPPTQIDVPDTQTEPQTNGAPSSTPATSADASKKRLRKGKKNVQAEHANTAVEHNTIPVTPYEEVVEEATPTASNTNEGRASRKRRREDKSRTSINSVDLDPEEVNETPPARQEEVSDPPAEERPEQNGPPGTGEQPLTPKALLGNLKAERSQKSQFAGKKSEPAIERKDVQEASPEDVDEPNGRTSTAEEGAGAEAGLSDAALATVRTPVPTQRAKRRKTAKKDKRATETPILDWEAPVRNLDGSPAQPFNFEDSEDGEKDENKDSANGAELSKSDRKKKPTRAKKTARPSVGGLATPSRSAKRSRADPNRNYQRPRDNDERTAADKALENTHELGQPPDKRTGGEFTADEKELLRRAIRDYQERNGLDTGDLVEIIQWSYTRKNEMGENTTDQTETQYKKDSLAFWDDMNSAGLLRKPMHIKKHVRSQYHTCQRGHWSQEEDEQLRDLANAHPGQWKLIATQLNRLELDVYNRWKDYVRHGENRITKRWTREEEENFIKVLSTVCQKIEDHRAETGKPPLSDYTPVINWHEVCREMGDTRSRLQCQSKWKLMRAREPPAAVDVEIKPRKTPEPGQVEAEEPQKKRRKSKAKKNHEPAVTIAELNPPGPEDMLWGDKFDLIGQLIEQANANGCETDDQIVWQDIAENLNQTWSVRTLQTAYKQLRELVDDAADEGLMASLASLYAFMVENHMSEMEDRYRLANDIEANEEDAHHANSSRKRKRQNGAGSANDSAKRNKTTLNSPKVFKSKEIITDSDNAESEPEL